jgi:hypothetical protein
MALIASVATMLVGIGTLFAHFGIIPGSGPSRAVNFSRADDFSFVKLEIAVARPWMLKVGMAVGGVGLVVGGVIQLLSLVRF